MSLPLEKTDPALDTKEKAEWDKAAEHMLGGKSDPDADDEGAGPDDDRRAFRYRGKTVKVDADTYEVLEGLRKESRGANGRLGSELARTRERLARMEATLAARETPQHDGEADLDKLRPDPKLATRDIDAWQAQNEIYQDAKVARRFEQLEQRYRAEVAQNENKAAEAARTAAWASRFYDTYDHLDDPTIKPVVLQAYLDNKHEIDALGDDTDGQHERLAELADERLLRLKRAGKGVQDPNDNRRRLPNLESSAGPTPRKPEEPDESRRNFSAGSWVAKERLKMTGRTPRKER